MLTASWRPYWGGLVPGTRPSFLPSMSSSPAERLLSALLLQPGKRWLTPEVAISVLLGGRGVSFFSHLVNFIPSGSVCQVLSVLVTISVCVPVLCSVMSQFFVTSWTVACQAPLSVEFSRQQYWSGLPISSSRGSPGLKDQTCMPYSLLHWQRDSLPFCSLGSGFLLF